MTRANTRQVLKKNYAEKKKENSDNKWFQSFNQSRNKSNSSGTSSSSSSLEQAFNRHFDINKMEDKELLELLQDSMMTESEDEPSLAAIQAMAPEIDPEPKKRTH